MPQLIDTARIANEPTLRYTTDGTAVLGLSLPCEYGRKGQDGKKPTQWVDATLWGKQAEGLAPYLVKGQWVAVTLDDVHIKEYQSQNQTKTKLVGRISHIKLVGSRPQDQGQSQPSISPAFKQPPAQPQQRNNAPANYDNFEDDIPF